METPTPETTENADALGRPATAGYAAEWHQACETAAVLLGLPGGLSSREFVEAVSEHADKLDRALYGVRRLEEVSESSSEHARRDGHFECKPGQYSADWYAGRARGAAFARKVLSTLGRQAA